MNTGLGLSAAEQEEYDSYLSIIREGPATAEAIGEPLWRIEVGRLYRAQVADLKTFFHICTKLEPEDGLRIIEEWKQTPRGRTVLSKHSTKDSGIGIAGAGMKDATPKPSRIPNEPKNKGTKRAAGEQCGPVHTEDQHKPDDLGVSATVAPTKDTLPAPSVATSPSLAAPTSPHTTQTTLALSDIRIERSVQSRATIKKAVVAEYAGRIKEGDQFPPLAVFELDGGHVLADGFHRHAAAAMAGLREFPVEIRKGTRTDAIRYSIESNCSHGLPRTNKDKRKAVALALTELAEQSDRAIASLCRVSHPFVSEIRAQLVTVTSSEKRVGRDKKRRKLPKTRPSGQENHHSSSTHGADGANADSQNPGNAQAAAASGGESREDNSETQTGRNAVFASSEAWSIVEDLLFAELEKWPADHRRNFGDQLRRFADQHCV